MTRVSCLGKPEIPPTQGDPLKQCSKQQVYNLEAALVQMWSRQQRLREAHKNTAAVKNKN